MSLLIIVPVFAGWISGWLVNYLADVLPITRSFSRPTCLHCGQNLPIVSYLTFRSCPSCHQQRNIRVGLVQAIMLIANLYVWFKPPFSLYHFHPPYRMDYVLGAILLTYFAMVFVIDFEHHLILHSTSIFGALFGLGLGMWINNGIAPSMIGGLAGLIIMLVFYYFGVLFSRIRAKRMQAAGQAADEEEALGFGDVILAGVLGLILGPFIWFGLLLGILLGGLIGIILVLYLMISKRYKKEALMVFMPYGPFFITSAFFILFIPTWIAPMVPK